MAHVMAYIYNLVKLVMYIFFVEHIVVFLINHHEEFLYACVCRAHVETFCFELICRSIIYLCYFFPCFAISLNHYMELLAHVVAYECFA